MRPSWKDLLLPTTVVGSYPVVRGPWPSRLFDPLRYAVHTAVQDQISAGIDIISDGQVRGDMVQAFTSRLPGIRGQEVIGTVEAAGSPIHLGDTKYALSKHPLVKGIVTGPSTLAHGLHIRTPLYRNRGELVKDLAHALIPQIRRLEDTGVAILQIDEPIFSTGAADMGVGRDTVAMLAAERKVPVCLHVCGDISGIVDDLLSMPVDILDLEFSGNEKNLEILSEKDLSGRMIGFGCVDSISPNVDDIDEIRRRIERGCDCFGADALLVDPDCGLRMHSREVAFAKLVHLSKAAGLVRKDLK
ncbi:MAG: methionine synthase [Methanoregulaceae archaeon]|nr:methionine synthase [Methanoregulaceae archaeon]